MLDRVNWIDVDHYLTSPDQTNRNSFQLVMVDRSDTDDAGRPYPLLHLRLA